ncbi:MAG: ribosome silencing factor [Fulvimarina manganoxydans]|uniref:ribosome silencing factor n=1 Tax=Fulvimarina manganoxydans TaxID=937218 RepID=UPI0023524CA2|nr:ribosome silencing factor [Fulvimarina manganoxydans]MCK5931615.1 ribosome silencing factor [Fulvimarina manganoxydans]
MAEVKNGFDAVASDTPAAVNETDARTVLNLVLKSLDDSKAEDLVSIDMMGKSALADHMVIASGRSHRHVSALADHLLRDLKAIGVKAPKVEGLQNGDWVLIDTGDLIVHIFRPEVRSFYNIEKMWSVGGEAVATVH